MSISLVVTCPQCLGHKTQAVFDGYHIVSPADLQEAARKMAGTIPGTMGESALDTATLSR